MKPIDTLEPDFRQMVENLLIALPSLTGRTWVITQGRRTIAEQRAIYAQGRTKPGKVVSNAPAGSSAHNYGLAADLAPLAADGKSIDWNADRSLWENMAQLAEEMGLTAGAHFRTILDYPHVEHPRWKAQLALWKSGKLEVA